MPPDTRGLGSVQTPFGLNFIQVYGPVNRFITDDDTYRRILTWHFYKGDGKYCSTEWLKRRVWRFLYGKDGWSPETVDSANIAADYQISISFGVDRNVTIRFVLGLRTVTGGAMCNAFGCNGFEPQKGISPPWDIGTDNTVPGGPPIGPRGIYINDLETTYVPYPPLPFMEKFKEGLDLGVLEVPYQFNFTCTIG
jgi:hypothetical protein